ncbi:MAG: hypothetical protein PHV20_02965 [Bacteroidales bacterium]|nr:hypothetical protein [Bacteroidales bacterium]
MSQDKIARYLLIIFYALAAVAAFSYFISGTDHTLFLYSAGAAIVVRLIHYFMKFFM